jgi:hypothetical protein
MPIIWDRLSANVGIKSVRTFALRSVLTLAVTNGLLLLPSVIPSCVLGQFPGPAEDGIEHRIGDPAGKGVLLTGVIAAKHDERSPSAPSGDADFRAVAEGRPRSR